MSPKVTMDILKGWMPDIPPDVIASAGGLAVAKNIIPSRGSYYPILSKAVYNSNAISGTPLAGVYAQDSDGAYYNFIGTSTKLYRFTGTGAPADVTKAAATYAATKWSFAPYGNWLIATDGEYAPQVIKGFSTSAFVDLGGTPPKAYYCLFDNGHLILANLVATTTRYSRTIGVAYPKSIEWSGREAVEYWSATYQPDLAQGSDTQDFPELLGVITGIERIGKKFAIFAEQSIAIGQYIGGTYTFAFERNAITNVGCFYPSSLFSISTIINDVPYTACFFWSQDSIWMLMDSGTKEIGKTIKETVFNDINRNFTNRISFAHWGNYSCVVWFYPSASSIGSPDKVLIYNYLEDRMTSADIGCACGFLGVKGGVLINDLSSTLIDNMNVPFDSYTGKQMIPYVVDTDGKVYDFSGPQMTATLETGELVEEPNVAMATKAYLPINNFAGSGTMAVKHRYAPTVNQTTSSATSIKSTGQVDLRTTNKRLAFNIALSGFSKIGNKIEVNIEKSGER